MKVEKNAVVSFEYTLRSDSGEVLDASEKGEPLAYIHGQGHIVPGLESALEGKAAGEAFDVKVPPAGGYGEHDAEGVFDVPLSKLPKGLDPKVGQELASRTPDGHVMRFRIVKLGGDKVTVDANHPLAGQNLNFSGSIVEVRAATGDELTHGHVHGAGGHHHH